MCGSARTHVFRTDQLHEGTESAVTTTAVVTVERVGAPEASNFNIGVWTYLSDGTAVTAPTTTAFNLSARRTYLASLRLLSLLQL